MGRWFSGGLSWFSRVSSGALVVGGTSACSGPTLGSCGVMLAICWIGSLCSLVLCTWSGEQRAWTPCATTCLCVADQPLLRKRLSSSSVDRDGWGEASHPGSTGSACPLLFSSSAASSMHWAVIDSASRLVVRVASSFARRSPVAKARISFDASRDRGDGDVGPTATSAFSHRPDVIITAMSSVQFDRLHLPAFCVRDQASACRSEGYPLRRRQRGTCTGTWALDADVDRSTLMPPRLGSWRWTIETMP